MAEYIDRDGVLAEYDRQHQGPPGGARKIIAEYPAADVKPVVHGKWIYDDKQVPLDEMGCPTGSCWCSECGDWLSASDEYSVRGYFCPNCGADMREQEPKPEPAPGPYDLLHEEGGWNLQ